MDDPQNRNHRRSVLDRNDDYFFGFECIGAVRPRTRLSEMFIKRLGLEPNILTKSIPIFSTLKFVVLVHASYRRAVFGIPDAIPAFASIG